MATPGRDLRSAAVKAREEVLVLSSPEQPGNALAAEDEAGLHGEPLPWQTGSASYWMSVVMDLLPSPETCEAPRS